MAVIDTAALRRFTFKVKCDFLSPAQTKIAFQHFFNLDAPHGIEKLNVLAPRDYAVVQKKATILSQLSDPGALLSMLENECSVKPETSKRIGLG